MAKKRGLHLEKVERGYEVQDGKWNTLGYVTLEKHQGRERWIFRQCLEGLVVSQLKRIVTLIGGIKE